MSRSSRPLRLLIPFILVFASLVLVRPPTLSAAAYIYYVDSALDVGLASFPTGCPANDLTVNKDCTLRQALERAESDGDTSAIQFKIPQSNTDPDNGYDPNTGIWTIYPQANLPALSAGDLTITGTLNFSGYPRIVLDGSNVPITDAIGLTISSAQNVIQALTVINFGSAGATGAGILISGTSATSNTIVGNYIGFRPPPAGLVAPNGGAGIRIEGGAAHNLIGGSLPGIRNIIAGNNGDGIVISGGSANTIQGNFIGVAVSNASMLAPFGNTGMGIRITNSNDNLIGGDQTSLGNTISANLLAGVLVTGAGSQNNNLVGNTIGTDDTGLQSIGNLEDGIQIASGAHNTQVFGTQTAHCIISGNNHNGVLISGYGSANNRVFNCAVGLADDGLTPLPNAQSGLLVENGASNNQFGLPSQGNVVAGNAAYGIVIGPPSTTLVPTVGNSVTDNTIGLGGEGTALAPNGQGGIMIAPNGADTTIVGNVISGNTGPGITITGTNTLNTAIISNVIGLRRDNTGALTLSAPNEGAGISLRGNAGLTRIGGAGSEANTIAASAGDAIELRGSGVTTTTISTNLIGAFRANGTLMPRGNSGNGIALYNGAQTTTISGTTITFNGGNGIWLSDALTTTITGVTVTANLLNGLAITTSHTTAISGAAVLSNQYNGFVISDSQATTVRGASIISNMGNGVAISTSQATLISAVAVTSNTLNGLLVSDSQTTTLEFAQVLSNTLAGVAVIGSTNTTVFSTTMTANREDGVRAGGAAAGLLLNQNTMRANGRYGVLVMDQAQQVTIRDNQMTRNTAGGVRLTAQTNHDILPPITDMASPLRARIAATGLLSGSVLTSTLQCQTCTLQIYAPDPSLPTPDGQGFLKLGETQAAPDGSFSLPLGTLAAIPAQVLLMATDSAGNSSEFGIFTRIFRLDLGPARSASAKPGETIIYSHRVTNTGTVDLGSLVFTTASSRDPQQRAWIFAVEPAQAFELRADESISVTLAVTLPSGSHSTVTPSPPDEYTTLRVASETVAQVSAVVTDTTTVLPKPIFNIEALSEAGSSPPATSLNYTYRITNSGNVSGMVLITPTIDLPGWQVSTTAVSVTLGPSEGRSVDITVAVPSGAMAGVQAHTSVDFSVTSDLAQSRNFTTITTVALVQNGDLIPENYDETVTAGQLIPLRHTVENRSNGPATFRLAYSAEFSSTVHFAPVGIGVPLDANNVFTLTNQPGSNFFAVDVEVTVNERLFVGETEVVRIFLTDASGTVIYKSTIDRLRVIKGNLMPHIWLPTIMK